MLEKYTVMRAAEDEYIKDGRTVEGWHLELRDNGDNFLHPNPEVASGKEWDPKFFSLCPDAKRMFLDHAEDLAALGKLTSEALADYLNSTIVENELKKWNEKRNTTDQASRRDFLFSFGFGRCREEEEDITILSRTVLDWMKRYGYKWSDARKHYYNDRHEHPDTIKSRQKFIHDVLYVYETRGARWISIPKQDADKLREEDHVSKDAGYEYELNGECYVEFHVDDCKSFHEYMLRQDKCGERSHLFIQANKILISQWEKDGLFDNKSIPKKAGYEYESFGTDMVEVHARHFKDDDDTRNKLRQLMRDNGLSFCQSVRPTLLIFGQDEAIYRQYLMTLKVWVRGGKQPIRPKDPGLGYNDICI